MAFKDNSFDVCGLGLVGWNELVRPLWKSWNAHILDGWLRLSFSW